MIRIVIFFIFTSCIGIQSSLKFSLEKSSLEPISSQDFLAVLGKKDLEKDKNFKLYFTSQNKVPFFIEGVLHHCDIEQRLEKQIETFDDTIHFTYRIYKKVQSKNKCLNANIEKFKLYRKEFSHLEYKRFALAYFQKLFGEVENLNTYKIEDENRYVIQFSYKNNDKAELETKAQQIIISLDELYPSLILVSSTGSKASYEILVNNPKKVFSQFKQDFELERIIKNIEFLERDNIFKEDLDLVKMSDEPTISDFIHLF